jgi:hypothetical protein
LSIVALCEAAIAQRAQGDISKDEMFRLLSMVDSGHECRNSNYFFGRRSVDRASSDQLLEIVCGVLVHKDGVCYLPAKVISLKCENGIDSIICAEKSGGTRSLIVSKVNYGLIGRSVGACAESIGMQGFASSSNDIDGLVRDLAIIRGAINKINHGTSTMEGRFLLLFGRESLYFI